MGTIHINAKKEDIANIVLMPGDPLRAKYIADNFLTNVVKVTDVRNMLGYTGLYKGKCLTVMGSGMGMPSMGIYAYELFTGYDVEAIIRIGSCGSASRDVLLRDVVLAKLAYNEGNFAKNLTGEENHIAYPDKDLNNLILDVYNNGKKDFNLKHVNICTTECFDAYITDKFAYYARIPEELNIEAAEMEAFALFETAKVLGKKASCLLTVVDSLYTDEKLTVLEREKDLNNMIELALEAAISYIK